MIVQSFSYHNHSDFSDGTSDIYNIVKRAKEIGFTEIGISDHLIVHKNFPQSKSQIYMQKRPCSHIYNSDFKKILDKFRWHCENIRNVSNKEKFKIYVGFEVDYFTYDGWFDELKDFLSQLDYDYLISGNHMLFDEKCEDVFDLNDLTKICIDKGLQKEYLQRHYETMVKSIDSGIFNFLAHLDYARKLGENVCGINDYRSVKLEIINALERNKTAMELSTKGLRKIGDFYPAKWILLEVLKRDISIIVSDDAHNLSELGLNFDLAENLLQEIGIKRRFVL